MIFHLMKKDFLVSKKYILFMAALVILLPVFIAVRSPETMQPNPMTEQASKVSGMLVFLLTTMYAELILVQQISNSELKCPKAQSLLCAAPYSRSQMVTAQYLFYIVLFAGCCILYGIASLVIPQVAPLSVEAVIVALFINAIVYGVLMPLQYRFGVEKTRFTFMIIFFLAAFGGPTIVNQLSVVDFSALTAIPAVALWSVLALAAVAVLWISAWISIRIYKQKDL